MLPALQLSSAFIFIVISLLPGDVAPKLRTEHFDNDPGWESINSRNVSDKKRTVRQDFGYSPTSHAGGYLGEAGGFFTPAAEPAFYAKKLSNKTLNDTLTASGRLNCIGKVFHVQLGFFNADTVNEWRTPNCIAIRLQGRGDKFFAYVEYATSQWRAGGDSPGGFATERDPKTGRNQLRGFPLNESMEWSLHYDPKGNDGAGTITVKLGSETSICHLNPGHQADGAVFNRFGLLNVSKSADTGGALWIDDVTINGENEDFTRNPNWDERGNRTTFESANIRPRFDFGYSPTHHAGGKGSGEMGGLVFRGDCRHAKTLAAYGDRLSILSLNKPLQASGKVSLRRAVTDSTVLLGFYHSKDSLEVNPSQSSGIPKSFVGVAIEGPSREGFLFYPMYRLKDNEQGYAKHIVQPRINPDGKSHNWSMTYEPSGTTGKSRVVVKLDDKSVALEMNLTEEAKATHFDCFGLITTWIDGNGQQVYFDDLTYTCEQ